MAAKFQRLLIQHPKTRPALRGKGNYALRQVRGVVIHWTANTALGADAAMHQRYFNNGAPGARGVLRAASAHYVVDDKAVIQMLPETEVAFHVGDKPRGAYMPAGQAIQKGYKSLTPNYFLLGTEMCVNKGSNWDATYENTVALTAEILLKHGLSADRDLYRHFDITGKDCPRPMLDAAVWGAFCLSVALRMDILRQVGQPAVVIAKELNVRTGPATVTPAQHTLLKGEHVLVYETIGKWCSIGAFRWVSSAFLQPINTQHL